MGLAAAFKRLFGGKRLAGGNRASLLGDPSWLAKRIAATYDAARTSDVHKNYWANADHYDADSAHNKQVRDTLVSRSRYEVNNNGFADGIAKTFATDLVGAGPLLRMQTRSKNFNQLVEREWLLWSKAVQLRRKLWCMAHAKYQDGEPIAVIRRNPGIRHPITLDVRLYETEQCTTPMIPFDQPGYIDGIKFDRFGNPQWYDILPFHPGAGGSAFFDMVPERVAADFVLHWFKLRRAGQHRAVPENASTLNTGAAGRRFREATLASAEIAARFSVLLKTQLSPDEADAVASMDQLELEKILMTALPMGWDAAQMKSEHPNASYEGFHRTIINEQARPVSMPYNKAACDSSDYNYASGRLDHQTYYGELDVDRYDCDDLVMDPLFDLWFSDAIRTYGWLGGEPAEVGPAARMHLWDWPKHRVADVEAEAKANQIKLKSGQIGLHRLYTEAGYDLEDEIPAMAETFGVSEDEIRKRLLDVILPPEKKEPGRPIGETNGAVAEHLLERFQNRMNGHAHATPG